MEKIRILASLVSQLWLDLLRRAEAVQQEAETLGKLPGGPGNIGNVHLYQAEYTTAIAYYQRALAIAREIRDPVSIRKWTYNANLAYMRMRAAIDQIAQSRSC